MTTVAVRSILGSGSVPSHRTSAERWLRRNGIETFKRKGNGGTVHYVRLADLPAEVRRALAEKHIAEAGLPPGDYDDAAHAR
nr:hypothetical protein [Paracoccaceae bacterium]